MRLAGKRGASTASASSFLFDAVGVEAKAERLSAAMEAAVQDIASEILGAEEGTMSELEGGLRC